MPLLIVDTKNVANKNTKLYKFKIGWHLSLRIIKEG